MSKTLKASLEKCKIGINRKVYDFDHNNAFAQAVYTKVSKRLKASFKKRVCKDKLK